MLYLLVLLGNICFYEHFQLFDKIILHLQLRLGAWKHFFAHKFFKSLLVKLRVTNWYVFGFTRIHTCFHFLFNFLSCVVFLQIIDDAEIYRLHLLIFVHRLSLFSWCSEIDLIHSLCNSASFVYCHVFVFLCEGGTTEILMIWRKDRWCFWQM